MADELYNVALGKFAHSKGGELSSVEVAAFDAGYAAGIRQRDELLEAAKAVVGPGDPDYWACDDEGKRRMDLLDAAIQQAEGTQEEIKQ